MAEVGIPTERPPEAWQRPEGSEELLGNRTKPIAFLFYFIPPDGVETLSI